MRIASFIAQSLAPAPRPIAGLDISDSHVRWVAFGQQARGRPSLQCHEWPLQAGWVEGGRVIEFAALAQALEQWVAVTGVHRLAMALPAEACASIVAEQPKRQMPWQRHAWLAQQASDLLARPVTQISWSAHALPGRSGCWRLMCTAMEWVQDWQGLAEAAGCELVCLDEAHQASWRALDRWHQGATPGAMVLQVGSACVQALQAVDGQWQWAWRVQAPADDVIAQCLMTLGSASELALIGHSALAAALYQGLQDAGCVVSQPAPVGFGAWAAEHSGSELSDAFWPALGLACGSRLA